jgi:hypothetical protein
MTQLVNAHSVYSLTVEHMHPSCVGSDRVLPTAVAVQQHRSNSSSSTQTLSGPPYLTPLPCMCCPGGGLSTHVPREHTCQICMCAQMAHKTSNSTFQCNSPTPGRCICTACTPHATNVQHTTASHCMRNKHSGPGPAFGTRAAFVPEIWTNHDSSTSRVTNCAHACCGVPRYCTAALTPQHVPLWAPHGDLQGLAPCLCCS